MKRILLLFILICLSLLLCACDQDIGHPAESSATDDTTAWQPIIRDTSVENSFQDTTSYPFSDTAPAADEEDMSKAAFVFDKAVLSFDYGNIEDISPITLTFNVPYYYYRTEKEELGDRASTFSYFSLEQNMELWALEISSYAFKVDSSFDMDPSFHGLTDAGGTWNSFDGYKVTEGTTTNGYGYVMYESPDDIDGRYSATVYLRISKNYIIRFDHLDHRENYSYLQKIIDSVFVKGT